MQPLKQRVEKELRNNILPFWSERTLDPVNGGFFGALSNTLEVDHRIPRSAILYSRILWTFSHACQIYPDSSYLDTARRAYEYLRNYFWDKEYGGVFWSVDASGQIVEPRKHTYAQAFAIYGLVEYYRATDEDEALKLARQSFELLERHAHDDRYGGYVEGYGRDWSPLEDMRLSDLEPVCEKTMNTLLHVMEAYTSLLSVWEESRLEKRLEELILIFLERVIDPETHHLRMFFHRDWRWERKEPYSYGHDIECSWLLIEAADWLSKADMLERTKAEAVHIAQVTYDQALQADGRVYYESAEAPNGRDMHWWVHAEALVGFYNAFQITKKTQYKKAAEKIWSCIEKYFHDPIHGDWFKVLDPDGKPRADSRKVGPWECPYHQSRACFEMLHRLP